MRTSDVKRPIPWNRALATATAALALLMSVMLASCGGGANGLAEVQPARAAAMAAPAITPEEAARQLMDFAESVFPQFFPGHETTLSLPPFVYRHYASTGIYLGVVVTDGTGFQLNGVYVMGGAFGDAPRYVGQLTDFITPADPGPVTQFDGDYVASLLILAKDDPCGKDKPVGSSLPLSFSIKDGVISNGTGGNIGIVNATVSANGDVSIVISPDPSDPSPCPPASVTGVISAPGAAGGTWDKPAGLPPDNPRCFLPPGAEDPGSVGCPGFSGSWTATRTS